MKTSSQIPVTPSQLNGRLTQLVEGRRLHGFLQVRRDFSTWMRERIAEYEFAKDEDFIVITAPPIRGAGNRGMRIDYFLTIGMAKELAMIERTSRGREARRYFLECERQSQRLHYGSAYTNSSAAIALSRGQRQAINRQAWADVAGQVYTQFHARRETLLHQIQTQARMQSQAQGASDIASLYCGFRPNWAR